MQHKREIQILCFVFVGLMGWAFWTAIPPALDYSPISETQIAERLAIHHAAATTTTQRTEPPASRRRKFIKNGVLMGQAILMGSGTFEWPAGATSITVYIVGGGSAGQMGGPPGGGRGGYGGGSAVKVFTSGGPFAYEQGTGGNRFLEGPGTTTTFGSMSATGGNQSMGTPGSGTGGDSNFTGGTPGAPGEFYGSGGGSSAGRSANGNTSVGSTGATAPSEGGRGGDGGTGGGGLAGSSPGGGGGGGTSPMAPGFTSESPGDGGAGYIQVDWEEDGPLPCGGVPPTKQFGAFGDLIAMLKNTSGQKIGSQMLTIADGSPFTGSVTVYVTGDAETQAAGSVGSGACTHEGNGYHTYAPSQAETNYDLIAFTFVGSGAYNQTIQVATQSNLSSDVAAIKAKTDNLPSDPADASDIASSFSTVNGKLDAIDDYVDTEMAAVKAVTDKLDTALENDGGVYRFTTNALEQAPTGGGGSAPTVEEIGDELETRSLTVGVIEADAIDAAAIKADAVTKIQTGLATPTNITAGTITTVTNLTNAPTNGDFTAAMKTSLDAATPEATVSGVVDANLVEIDGETDRVTAFGRAVDAIGIGTVGTGSTTSRIVTSSIDPDPSVLNQFRPQIVCFSKRTTTVALRNYKGRISATDSGGEIEMVEAMPAAPANGDIFTLQ